MNSRWDAECAVIGGGPGGLVSTLYLKRFRRDVVLFQSGKPRAAWIPRTHNVLGFPEGIGGIELLTKLHQQIDHHEVPKIAGQATLTKLANGGFEVSCGQRRLKVPAVILATGFQDIQPKIENLVELRKSGLLRYCPICDAYEFRDKKIAVLAQDEDGIERALFLHPYSRNLEIILPPGVSPSAELKERIRRAEVSVTNGELLAIEPHGNRREPEGVWVHQEGHEPTKQDVVYVELGSIVNDSAFRNLPGIRRSKEGFLITTRTQRSSLPALYAVGDCVDLLGQISVAAGQAAVAATMIHNELTEAEEG